MFNLNDWAKKSEDSNVLTYTIKGISDTALLVRRSDKSTDQQFTKVTFQDLLSKGKLKIVDNTTFTVEKDKDYNPLSQFKAIDLG